MSFLLKYWKELGALLLLITVFGAGYLVRDNSADLEIKILKAEVDTLQDTVLDREADIKQCNDQKKITEKQSNDFQKGLAARDRTIADLRRLRENAKCIPIIPR